jgi:cytochrome c oxidase assembly protein subunit 15
VVLSWFTAALAYLQLVLGAHLRHIDVSLSPSQFRIWVFMHLLVAAVVTVEVLVLSFLVWRRYGSRDVRGLGVGIALLVTLQLALGIGAWTVKYGWPQWLPGSGTWLRYTVQAESMLQAVTVTAHVAAGSLIWVLCVMLALRLTRRTKLPSSIPEESETSRSDVQLEVVA